MSHRHTDRWPAGTRRSGFTLVELLVVMMIMVLLMGILVPTLARARVQILINKSKATVAILESGCEMYYTDHKMFPPSGGYYPDGSSRLPSVYRRRASEYLAQCLTGHLSNDGADGWGWRIVEKGKVYSPYPKGVEKHLREASAATRRCFRDEFGNMFFYYCWETSPGAFFQKYNADDNGLFTTAPDLPPAKSTETDKLNTYAKKADGKYYRTNFIIVSAGPDAVFADVKTDRRTDDITNFLDK